MGGHLEAEQWRQRAERAEAERDRLGDEMAGLEMLLAFSRAREHRYRAALQAFWTWIQPGSIGLKGPATALACDFGDVLRAAHINPAELSDDGQEAKGATCTCAAIREYLDEDDGEEGSRCR